MTIAVGTACLLVILAILEGITGLPDPRIVYPDNINGDHHRTRRDNSLQEVDLESLYSTSGATSYWPRADHSPDHAFIDNPIIGWCSDCNGLPQTLWKHFQQPLKVYKISFQGRRNLNEDVPSKFDVFGSHDTDCTNESSWVILGSNDSGMRKSIDHIEIINIPADKIDSFTCYGLRVRDVPARSDDGTTKCACVSHFKFYVDAGSSTTPIPLNASNIVHHGGFRPGGAGPEYLLKDSGVHHCARTANQAFIRKHVWQTNPPTDPLQFTRRARGGRGDDADINDVFLNLNPHIQYVVTTDHRCKTTPTVMAYRCHAIWHGRRRIWSTCRVLGNSCYAVFDSRDGHWLGTNC